MTYLMKRGRGALRRVAHIAEFNPIGQATGRPICGDTRLCYDLTSNVPWGLPTCKRCKQKLVRPGEQRR